MNAVIVKVKKVTNPTHEAPMITDEAIIERATAIARGKRYLEDPDMGGYYRALHMTVRAPFNASYAPGVWVRINSSRLNINMLMKIESFEHIDNKAWTTLHLVGWLT